MSFIADIPIWALALLIFVLRVVDVSMGTMRTLAIVEGKIKASVILGFFEVLVWIVVVSQVIVRINESVVLVLAYAGGFAAGNAVGIAIERRLAFGTAVIRLITANKGDEVTAAMRQLGQTVTSFPGEGRDGPVELIYATVPRRDMARLVEAARRADPELFFVVERANTLLASRRVVAQPTGWRAFWKKK